MEATDQSELAIERHRILPRYMDAQQVADYLGCTRKHVIARLKNKITYTKMGRRIMFEMDDVLNYVQSLKRGV